MYRYRCVAACGAWPGQGLPAALLRFDPSQSCSCPPVRTRFRILGPTCRYLNVHLDMLSFGRGIGRPFLRLSSRPLCEQMTVDRGRSNSASGLFPGGQSVPDGHATSLQADTAVGLASFRSSGTIGVHHDGARRRRDHQPPERSGRSYPLGGLSAKERIRHMLLQPDTSAVRRPFSVFMGLMPNRSRAIRAALDSVPCLRFFACRVCLSGRLPVCRFACTRFGADRH